MTSRKPMFLLAVVLAAAGCGRGAAAGGAPESKATPTGHVTVYRPPVSAITPLECGQRFRPRAEGALTVTGRFPGTVRAGEAAVTGTVEVTSHEAVRGVVSPRADVFLVQNGRLVTVPAAQDLMGIRLELAPGAIERLPGEAPLVSCNPDGGPVPPGKYEVYARVVLSPDNGTSVESFGGPWALDVR